MEPAAKKPTRDPPVLLHACKEFAIFGIKACGKRPLNVNEIIQLTTLKTCASMCSLQSSDSDSSLTYRSPAILASGEFSPTCAISPLPALNVGSTGHHGLRTRSQSECGPGFPLKGILKRRPICRSLSECHDSSSPTSVDQTSDSSLMAKYCQRCSSNDSDQTPPGGQSSGDGQENAPVVVPKFDCRCFDGGDCSDIVDDEISAYSTSMLLHNKKSVTFNERVEQNIFRPGSSIMGQRKKNQRKAKSRKRKGSCDSMLSLEEICEVGGSCNDDDDVDDPECSPLVSPVDQSSTGGGGSRVVDAGENDGRDQRFGAESCGDTNNNEDGDDDAKKSQDSPAAKQPEKCPDHLAAVTTPAMNQHTKHSANNSIKNCKKKKPNDKKSSTPPPAQQLIACDKYKGFLLNPSVLSFCSSSSPSAAPLAISNSPLSSPTQAHLVHHRDQQQQQQRLNSVDSAVNFDVGDDDGEDSLNNNNNNSNDDDDDDDRTINYCTCMDCANDSPPQLISIDFANRAFDQSDCSFNRDWAERKDSGLDEDMEQLCERMCDTLLSA